MENFLEELEKAKTENLYKKLFWLAVLVNALVVASIIYLAK